jgi:hypothetical protein
MEHNEERRSWPVIYHRDSPNEYIDGLRAAFEFLRETDPTAQASDLKVACVFIEGMREVDTDDLSREDRDRLWGISSEYGELKNKARQQAEFELEPWRRTTEQYIAEDNMSAITRSLDELTGLKFALIEAPPELSSKIQDVYARARIMSDFRQSEVGYGWFASNNCFLKFLINENEVNHLYQFTDAQAESALSSNVYNVLLRHQNCFGSNANRAWLGHVSDVIKDLMATPSLSGLKFVLNLIIPLYYHAAKSNRMKDLVDILAKAQSRIWSLSRGVTGMDRIFCHQLNDGLRGIGLELDPLLFGTAMHFYTDISDDVERLPLTELPSWIAGHCGNDAESITKYLMNDSLYKLARELSEAVIQHFETEEVRDYYVQIGFLILDSLPLKIIVKPTPIPADPPEADGANVPDLPDIETEIVSPGPPCDPVVGVNMARAWQVEHDNKYRDLRSDKTLWERTLLEVEQESRGLCDEILKGEILDLPAILSNKWKGSIRRVLIARWTMIAVERHLEDHLSRMHRMGWLREPKMGIEYASGFGSYRQYCHKLGFLMPKQGNVLEKSYLWPEERDWLDKYTPPK